MRNKNPTERQKSPRETHKSPIVNTIVSQREVSKLVQHRPKHLMKVNILTGMRVEVTILTMCDYDSTSGGRWRYL